MRAASTFLPGRRMLPNLILTRLSNHLLSAERFAAPEQAAAWMGAVQAQDYAGAKWALGLRSAAGADAQVEAALEAHALVRTWVPRGTLHFLAAADLGWMTALLGPRVLAGNAGRYRQLELDVAALERGRAGLHAALLQNGPLDRRELRAVLERLGVSTAGQRFPYLLQNAALHGLVFQSVTRRGQAVYSAREALPQAPPLEKDAALAELARRYFQSHGPAGIEDFSWWSGLSAGESRSAIGLARADLVEEQIDARPTWRTQTGVAAPPPFPAAWLLPAFDEYLVAYRERSAVLEPGWASRLERGGILAPCVVIDGRAAGVWRRTLRKTAVDIELDLFDPLQTSQIPALEAAAGRYAGFIGRTPQLRFLAAAGLNPALRGTAAAP